MWYEVCQHPQQHAFARPGGTGDPQALSGLDPKAERADMLPLQFQSFEDFCHDKSVATRLAS
jgi:hypothetical protein